MTAKRKHRQERKEEVAVEEAVGWIEEDSFSSPHRFWGGLQLSRRWLKIWQRCRKRTGLPSRGVPPPLPPLWTLVLTLLSVQRTTRLMTETSKMSSQRFGFIHMAKYPRWDFRCSVRRKWKGRWEEKLQQSSSPAFCPSLPSLHLLTTWKHYSPCISTGVLLCSLRAFCSNQTTSASIFEDISWLLSLCWTVGVYLLSCAEFVFVFLPSKEEDGDKDGLNRQPDQAFSFFDEAVPWRTRTCFCFFPLWAPDTLFSVLLIHPILPLWI